MWILCCAVFELNMCKYQILVSHKSINKKNWSSFYEQKHNIKITKLNSSKIATFLCGLQIGTELMIEISIT